MIQPPRWRGSVLDPYCIGRNAFLVVCIPSVLGTVALLPEGISLSRGFAVWLAASIVSTGLLGLVLLASARLRSRVTITRSLMPVAVLVTMVLAGAARGVGVVVILNLADIPDASGAAGRIVGSAVIFTVWLALIGGILSSVASYRAARQALLDEIVMRELQMRLVNESRAADQRETAAARMADTNEMVREILESAEVGQPDEYSRISLLLHRAIDERIRPLVHEMWFEPSPEFEAPQSHTGFLRRAYLTPIPLIWAMSLYAVIETAGACLALGLRLGVQAALIESAAFALVIVGERILRPRPGFLARTFTFLLLLVLPLTAAWVALHDQTQGLVPWFILVGFVLTAPILALACCTARAVFDKSGPSLQELQQLLERDEWTEQLETLERRAAENSLASVIHNTVQSRLLAAALQLETAAMTNDQGRAEGALLDARIALDSAQLSEAEVATAAESRLQSIADAWQGIIEVGVELDDGVLSGPNTRMALDVIEECVANAARHSSASVVDVSLRSTAGGLEVHVRDNGTPFTTSSAPGMGSDWMLRISAGRMTKSRSAAGWNQVSLVLGGEHAASHA